MRVRVPSPTLYLLERYCMDIIYNVEPEYLKKCSLKDLLIDNAEITFTDLTFVTQIKLVCAMGGDLELYKYTLDKYREAIINRNKKEIVNRLGELRNVCHRLGHWREEFLHCEKQIENFVDFDLE